MRYKILGSDVLDTQTNLVWRSPTEVLTYAEALEYAERISRETGQVWRVPTVEELASLVDRSRRDPSSAFPDMPSAAFWSSSPCVGNSAFAWIVGFSYGLVNFSHRSNYSAVRLVRDMCNG